jgi:hypothetical protein
VVVAIPSELEETTTARVDTPDDEMITVSVGEGSEEEGSKEPDSRDTDCCAAMVVVSKSGTDRADSDCSEVVKAEIGVASDIEGRSVDV